MILLKSLQQYIDKGRGPSARALDRMPKVAQEAIAKLLAYPYHYPQLDSFTKALMAAQLKQGYQNLIDPHHIESSRQQFDANMQSIVHKPTPISHIEDIPVALRSGNIYARHYHPAPNKKLPMLVFYHGGGFIVGSIESHDEVCRMIAAYAKVQVLSIEYPLAPEVGPHELIQCCEDALAWVYQHRNQFKILKNRIAVGGDSAGGNISTIVAQRAAQTNYAAHAQLLIYPVVDFKSRHPSYYGYQQGLILTGQDIDTVTHYYAKQYHIDLEDPIISPHYGRLKKLAPAFVVTAGHDVLHDEGKIYAYKLRQNGVKVEYVDYEDQTHGFVNLTSVSKKARKNLIEISKAFRAFWDKNS
ncbi:alpha/beta hydrolase [Acinetobacter larvae]|uniref:Esterase n=1 Tax=Acinetobacter larvae TaxID=1789224 RepID=A0A1B2LVL0_9GAMM|nr:alpha/beta hydrolase [Acinetobacter larvae]AOA56957.1 esterase [Acinetobacter larvae]